MNIKKIYKYIAAPAFVALMMLAIFLIYNLYPFSNYTISWCDMRQQVVPLFSEFKSLLEGEGNLFINMQNAGGMNFMAPLCYFLASPLSLLVKFVEYENIALFMNILVIIKMSFCAFSANYYFIKKFKNVHWSVCSIYSVMYAFCGYTMLFYQIISWLDIMMLFPVLLLALDRLIERKTVGLYIVVLSIAILQNFYLSYNLVIFLILFFGAYCLLEDKGETKKETVALFSISSVISFLITSPVWFTVIFQYSESARGENIFNTLSRSMFFAPLYTTLAFMFCTSIIFASLPLILLNIKNLNIDTKRNLILFVFSMVPIFIEPINKMWQTGSYQAFPVRYGYIPVFLGILLSLSFIDSLYSNTLQIKSKKRAMVILGIFLTVLIFIILVMLMFFWKDMVSYSKRLWVTKESFTYIFVLSITSLMCYFIGIYLFKHRYISSNLFIIFLAIVAIMECFCNTSIYIIPNKNNSSSYQQMIDMKDKIKEDDFYRVKFFKKYFPVNMIGAMGYPSLSHFTSFTSESYLYSMKKIGYSSYWMEVNSTGGTKFTDVLLSNRYVLKSNEDVNSNDSVIYSNDEYSMVDNEISIPLGLKIKSDSYIKGDLQIGNRFDLQQKIYELLSGDQTQLFTKVSPINTSNLIYNESEAGHSFSRSDMSLPATLYYQLHVDGKQSVYFDCFDNASTSLKEINNDSFSVFVNGKTADISYPSQKNSGILDLGYFEDEDVIIEIRLKKDVICKSFGVYMLDEANLQKCIENLNTVDLKVNVNKVYGTCYSSGGEDLYISIPYSVAYRAKVNGVEVPINKANGTFMAVNLPQGDCNIEIEYFLSLWKIGACMLCLGMLILGLFLKFKSRVLESVLIVDGVYCLFIVLLILVILAIYLFPLIVNIIL